MAEFFRNIIPVSLPVWFVFFILPAAIALAGQIILCIKCKRRWLKLIPLSIAALCVILVLIYRYTGFLEAVIGGFVALFLLGTAAFIVGGSIVGWGVYGTIRALRKR